MCLKADDEVYFIAGLITGSERMGGCIPFWSSGFFVRCKQTPPQQKHLYKATARVVRLLKLRHSAKRLGQPRDDDCNEYKGLNKYQYCFRGSFFYHYSKPGSTCRIKSLQDVKPKTLTPSVGVEVCALKQRNCIDTPTARFDRTCPTPIPS